jgi:RNA polymerase sigma-70 factor (ECF subfamily)
MDNAVSFADLLRRVRDGDEAAAAELVRRAEPAIRRAVRLKLTDPRLRRAFDSMDVCQSVLGNFFARVRAGQFELDSPEQLTRLLTEMTYNKVCDLVRHEHADRRDQRRVEAAGEQALESVAAHQDTPSEVLAGNELLERVHALLKVEERYLLEQRRAGRDWADLAAECGTTAAALRMQHNRTMKRVYRQLGLGEAPDD